VMFNVLELEVSRTFFSTEKINSRGEKDDNFSHADVSVVSRFQEGFLKIAPRYRDLDL